MKNYIHKSPYFYGNKVSDYGLKNGYVDYATLAKSFDAVLVNDITKLFHTDINGEYSEAEIVNGLDYDDENDSPIEIYQFAKRYGLVKEFRENGII